MARLNFGHCIGCDQPIRPPYLSFKVMWVEQGRGDGATITEWDEVDVCAECAGKLSAEDLHRLVTLDEADNDGTEGDVRMHGRFRDFWNLHRARRRERPLDERVATLENQMEQVMADIDTLNSTLDAIGSDASELVTEHQALLDELTQLQQQVTAGQPVDLSGAIAKANSIKETLDGIVTAATSSGDASGGATQSQSEQPASDTAAPTS